MTLKPGDRVAYAARFLRSISCFTGGMPQARGVIRELVPIGTRKLAVIAWESGSSRSG